MKNLYIIFLLLSFIVEGCYDDKGNYKYEKLNEAQVIDGIEWRNTVSASDTLRLNPVIEFTIKENNNVRFEWEADGEVISNEKNLKIYAGDLPKKPSVNAYFTIIDLNNGCRYRNEFNIDIVPKYNEGFVLLTKKDGKSDLTFVNKIIKEDEKGEIVDISYVPILNAYSTENGEKINGESYSIRQHWSDSYSLPGYILLVNSNGNLDINSNTLIKEFNTSDFFLDGQVPNGFSPIAESYLTNYSYILDKSGKLYSRKHADEDMIQSGRYVFTPVYLEKGMNITHMINCVNSYNKAIMLYDKLNQRYIFADNKGRISEISTSIENFSNLADLQKNLVFSQFYEGTDWCKAYFYSLLKDDSHYYIQSFRFYSYYFSSNGFSKNYADEYIFEDNGIITDDSKFLRMRFQDKFFISNNDKLYLYDTQLKTQPELFYDFAGRKITSLAISRDNYNIAVGLENGDFVLLKVSTKTIAGVEDKKVYELSTGAGEITDITYKYESSGDFKYGW